jgi:hypothetical protein
MQTHQRPDRPPASYATVNNCYIFLACLVSLIVGSLSVGYITDRPLISDDHQNARIAYHLAHTGVWGYDEVETPTPKPQIRREPLPILVIASFMIFDPAFKSPFTIKDVTSGPQVVEIKKVNILWNVLASLAIFLLVGELFRSAVTAAVVSVATIALTFYTIMVSYTDRMMTEVPAILFMLLASWFAVRFVHDRSRRNAILFGIALGLLTLVKAAFLYIGVCFVLLLFLVQPSIAADEGKGRFAWPNLLRYGIIIVALLATLTPWIARNVSTFGMPVVTGRGGDVLAFRALQTEQSLSDLFYYFSHPHLKPAVAKIIGNAPSHEAIHNSYIQLKKNRWKIFQERMEAAGVRFSGKYRAEPWLTRDAVSYYLNNPDRYVLSCLLFAYRGMWFLDGATLAGGHAHVETAVIFINGIGVVVLIATVLWAVLRRDALLVAAFGLAAGSFLFYSLLTHNIPRYSDPIAPFLFICLFWWIVAAGKSLMGKLPLYASRGNTASSTQL